VKSENLGDNKASMKKTNLGLREQVKHTLLKSLYFLYKIRDETADCEGRYK
jgi:hypothetical protein